jgi:hypothetical protein
MIFFLNLINDNHCILYLQKGLYTVPTEWTNNLKGATCM